MSSVSGMSFRCVIVIYVLCVLKTKLATAVAFFLPQFRLSFVTCFARSDDLPGLKRSPCKNLLCFDCQSYATEANSSRPPRSAIQPHSYSTATPKTFFPCIRVSSFLAGVVYVAFSKVSLNGIAQFSSNYADFRGGKSNRARVDVASMLVRSMMNNLQQNNFIVEGGDYERSGTVQE